MRAAVIEKFNEPWVVRDMPDPKPAPGQVVIKMHASGLCYTDLHAHHGAFPLKPPFVAGHEPAGVIAELGPGVTDLRVGDRVGVFWNQRVAAAARCARPAAPAVPMGNRGFTSAAATPNTCSRGHPAAR